MEYSFVTKGKANPKGKDKAYLIAHGEDIERFSSLCREIVYAVPDIAIAIAPDEILPSDTDLHFEMLGRMKLAILPVTRKLLFGEDALALKEAKYALEKHVPLIPFMEEDGLIEKYTEINPYLGEFDMKRKTLEYLVNWNEELIAENILKLGDNLDWNLKYNWID